MSFPTVAYCAYLLRKFASSFSGFLLKNYFVDKLSRLLQGMTLRAVAYCTNFHSPQQPTARNHRKFRITSRKRKINQNPFQPRNLGPYIEKIHEKNRGQKISRYCTFKEPTLDAFPILFFSLQWRWVWEQQLSM